MTSAIDPHIDPGIAELILAMNESGLVKTIASCQGHFYKRGDPYVYFAASEAMAARIESALRKWSRGPEKRLCTTWTLMGFFNSECQLSFRLMSFEYYDSCTSSLWWAINYFFKKRQIQRDLRLLAELFRKAFQHRTTGDQ